MPQKWASVEKQSKNLLPSHFYNQKMFKKPGSVQQLPFSISSFIASGVRRWRYKKLELELGQEWRDNRHQGCSKTKVKTRSNCAFLPWQQVLFFWKSWRTRTRWEWLFSFVAILLLRSDFNSTRWIASFKIQSVRRYTSIPRQDWLGVKESIKQHLMSKQGANETY